MTTAPPALAASTATTKTRPLTSQNLTFYPAYTYKVSPTFSKWVKITAKDIHDVLVDRRGHDGLRHLWFYLNHPIQYVDVTAPIVAIEPLGAGDKFALLTLDDGSGAVIGVKITRLLDETSKAGKSVVDGRARRNDDDDDAAAAAAEPGRNQVDYPSNTTVANVNVHARFGSGRFAVTVDDVVLEVGTVLRVKCTVGTWWGAKQLELLRASVVRSTRREVVSWRELARFKKNVLSSPWVLRDRQVQRLEREWKEEQDRETRARLKWSDWQRRKKERELKAEAAYEITRRKEEAEMNEGALI